MELERKQAVLAIYAAIDEFNVSSKKNKLEKAEDTSLFGEGAPLDSLELVNIVMSAEQYISEMAESDIVLASEAAMSRRRSPYRSVGDLADYAVEVSKNGQ